MATLVSWISAVWAGSFRHGFQADGKERATVESLCSASRALLLPMAVESNFLWIMGMLKNPRDLGGCSWVLQSDQKSVLYWLYHALIACEFQSFALLDCSMCGRAASDR